MYPSTQPMYSVTLRYSLYCVTMCIGLYYITHFCIVSPMFYGLYSIIHVLWVVLYHQLVYACICEFLGYIIILCSLFDGVYDEYRVLIKHNTIYVLFVDYVFSSCQLITL